MVYYARRLRRLHQLMVEAQLDGLVYGIGPDLRYFTGLAVNWPRESEPATPNALLAVTADGTPRLLIGRSLLELAGGSPVPCEVASSPAELTAALARFLRKGRIGVSRPAGQYLGELVTAALPGAECVDAEHLTVPLRMIKDEAEIAALRRVVALTDRVMERVIDHVRPGITQQGLEELIGQTGTGWGAEDVSFAPAGKFVETGSEPGADPFTYPPDQGLVPGSSIAFDFGFVLDGYCSDFGRSFYCGPAPEHISGAYRALQEAQCHLISQMAPGRFKLGELFGVLEAALDERGYGDRLRARLPEGNLGHQIGIDLHEDPWLRRDCDVPLQEGMVMAIEPKVWLPGDYYLRVEDIVLVTSDGAESLTNFDRNLFELPT